MSTPPTAEPESAIPISRIVPDNPPELKYNDRVVDEAGQADASPATAAGQADPPPPTAAASAKHILLDNPISSTFRTHFSTLGAHFKVKPQGGGEDGAMETVMLCDHDQLTALADKTADGPEKIYILQILCRELNTYGQQLEEATWLDSEQVLPVLDQHYGMIKPFIEYYWGDGFVAYKDDLRRQALMVEFDKASTAIAGFVDQKRRRLRNGSPQFYLTRLIMPLWVVVIIFTAIIPVTESSVKDLIHASLPWFIVYVVLFGVGFIGQAVVLNNVGKGVNRRFNNAMTRYSEGYLHLICMCMIVMDQYSYIDVNKEATEAEKQKEDDQKENSDKAKDKDNSKLTRCWKWTKQAFQWKGKSEPEQQGGGSAQVIDGVEVVVQDKAGDQSGSGSEQHDDGGADEHTTVLPRSRSSSASGN